MAGDGINTFSSMAAIRAAFNNQGSFWFSPNTMRAFRSKIETGVIKGCYFITSEQFESDTPRLFNIRKVVRHEDAFLDIETIGEHMTYTSLAQAKKALEELS